MIGYFKIEKCLVNALIPNTLATRINDSPVGKYMLPVVLGMITGSVDTTSELQQIFNRRFYGAMGVGAGWAIAESEIKFLKNFAYPKWLRTFLGFNIINTFFIFTEGKPNYGVYIPLIVGAVAGAAINKGAEVLYNSGLTMPIYSKLGIKDRRLPINQLPR